MAEIHDLKAKNVEAASEVSTPELSQTHHLKAESVESATEASAPMLSEIVEKIQLTDRVSEAERDQMLRWVKERFEEIWNSIEELDDIIEIVQNELSEFLSSDAIQFLIEFLQNLP
ncbi:MAG: hypothetical protein KUG71_14035 [Porticoccaceae bacterium]|nr:hypothetical protein [Porticoccaceae bacterium]